MLRWFESDNRLAWVSLALVLAAGWSTSGLIFRSIEDAGSVQIIFYRSVCLASAVASFVAFRYRISTLRAFRSIGWPGLIGAVGLGTASIAFIMAVERTTIANISFLIATTPFFVGALAWIVMREAMSPRTVAAAFIAMAGVAVMVGDGFSSGDWDGNLLALACALLSSLYVVAVRYGRGRDMIPAVALSGAIAAGMVAAVSDHLAITAHDLLLCAVQGILVSAVCNALFTLCARHIPAAELTLLSMVESVLAPFWVFAFLGEIPATATIAGGAVIMSAIALQAVWPGHRVAGRQPGVPGGTSG